MTEEDIIKYAEDYLSSRKIKFVKLGSIGKREDNRVEVIFLVPEALDLNAVVDS